MNIIDFSSSSISVLPPILALGLAIVTRRVLLSLGVGIISGAILLNDYSLPSTVSYIFSLILGLFIDNGGINTWNMSIILFLIFLGMITALLTLSGGTKAFAIWAQSRVKTQRGARLLAVFLGVFIFVDDYFNSLAVGAITRPVTDRLHVSRAKLAYILDSTAAPMCVLMPISSWGAYIITVISGVLISQGVNDYSALGAFAQIIPMNFYAIFALLMVFAVAWFQMDVGAMRRFEYQASAGSRLMGDDESHLPVTLVDEMGIFESDKGKITDLIIPILMLIICTVFWMIYSGSQILIKNGNDFSIIGAFENTDVGMSLLYGSIAGFVIAFFNVIKQKISPPLIMNAMWKGAKSMFGAVLILFFAWSIGRVIGDMETGKYLSSLIQGNIPHYLLPVLLFLLSAIMAFSTGTSWGTFGIMLPIAGDLAAATDIIMLLPVLSAVLAGAVFGDHCSPISDTTILSATGARCGHIDHVLTQFPYAFATAFIAAIAYLVLGVTNSLMSSFFVGFIIFIIVCFSFQALAKRQEKNIIKAK